MANYSVDIEVALKGVEKLRQFEKTIGRTVSEVEKLTKALKEVKQQNPYDVTGARRVTQFEKERLKVIKAQNDALAQQKRLVADRLGKESRANLKALRPEGLQVVRCRCVPLLGWRIRRALHLEVPERWRQAGLLL